MRGEGARVAVVAAAVLLAGALAGALGGASVVADTVDEGPPAPAAETNPSTAATWYLTATEVTTLEGSSICPATPTYRLDDQPPAGEAAKAYLGHANLAGSCPVVFQRGIDEVVEIDGDASVALTLGCDVPTPFLGADGVRPAIDVDLVRNGGEFAGFDLDGVPLTCSPDEPTRLEGSAEGVAAQLLPGDTFGVSVQAWGLNPAPVLPTIYVVVGGPDAARATIGGWTTP